VVSEFSTRDQAIVLLAHDGALRREEIVRLRVDDIDWRTHTITIRAEITKNKMPGIIVLAHPTFTKLKEYIEEDRAALVMCYGAEADGLIFCQTRQGTLASLSPNGPSRTFLIVLEMHCTCHN
jgi:integrase